MSQEYIPIEQLYGDQVAALQRLYNDENWSRGRSVDDIKRMLRHTDVIVGFAEPETDQLIAFARVLTDYAYKALILDVIVDRRFRTNGLGRQLMDAVIHHPMLQRVEQFELYCRPELAPFYAEWGFTDTRDDDVYLLRRTC